MKRNSIAFKLYSMGRYVPEDNTDICTYITKLTGNLGLFIIFGLFISTLAILGGTVLLGIIEVILNVIGIGGWMFYFGWLGSSGLVFIFIIVAAATIISIGKGISIIPTLKLKDDNILKLAYKSWKDNVCFKIKFED